ncbi:tetratricopeptide repeat protein [Pelagicoccus sp. SDUM812003]|uniref:tetratricopeptide repeat protein n=1 Tax=Pelagicoccus sp. SDUM812003 TaxID=3041267 RepID=UPI00280C527C|nr:tetratricopeptide repeat protein [Pelagicoccus sp. SDUM812003]MDQ8202571.1 tetratricopeptide repeat protein [Pelagicoccus sp. SDUM812003]
MVDKAENEDPSPETPSPFEPARKAIAKADATAQRDPRAIEEAIKGFDEALALLDDASLEEGTEKQHLRGWAVMGKANAQVNTHTKEGIEAGIQGYQEALKHFEAIKEPNPSHLADIAAVWGNIGHTQFRTGQKEALAQAENCFHQAISILEKLPWKENARFRHQLAATYLNLGNAFARQSNPAKPEVRTINAFEAALRILEDQPVEEFAIGSLVANIRSSVGRALMWSSDKSNLQQAVASFDETIRVLAKIKQKDDPRLAMEMASAHANRANLLSRAQPSKESIQETISSSEFALRIVKGHEENNLLAAEVSLSARRSLCHAFGLIIGGQSAEKQQEIHDKASDLLEDGLKLVKTWESRGARGLRPSAQHLFHLGCAFYCTQQPHFLPEFVNENLNLEEPDQVMRESAERTIKEALSRMEKADAADSEVANVLKKTLAKVEAPAPKEEEPKQEA